MKTLSIGQKLFYLLLFLPCLLITRNMDNDIWFILNNGKYVCQYGVPYIEPFTIHEGMSYVMQQWMSSIIFWKTYSILGELGLVIIVVSFYIVFAYLAFKLSMYLSDNNFPVSFVICMLSNILIYPFMVQRPHIFLFTIIILEVFFLEKYIENGNYKYIFFISILSILLINLEAALWPILIIILIPYLIDSFNFKFKFISGQGFNKKGIILVIICVLVAGLINPYGLNAMTYLFNSYGAKELRVINELAPPNINTLFGMIIYISIFTVCLLQLIYRKGNYKLRYILLSIGTLYLTLSALRNFFFFIICGMIVFLSYFFKDYKMKINVNNDSKTLLIRKMLIALITLTLISTIIYIHIPNINSDAQYKALNESVTYLERYDKKSIRLYTGFNEGGYLEFKGFKTYIDPRAEVFFIENNKKYDIMQEYIELKSGSVYYHKILDKYNFTHLLVSDNDILFTYLDYDEDYTLLYSNKYYKIYKNKGYKK